MSQSLGVGEGRASSAASSPPESSPPAAPSPPDLSSGWALSAAGASEAGGALSRAGPLSAETCELWPMKKVEPPMNMQTTTAKTASAVFNPRPKRASRLPRRLLFLLMSWLIPCLSVSVYNDAAGWRKVD